MASATILLQLGVAAEQADAGTESLLEGLRSGSEEAFEALLAAYQTPVYNLVARLIEHPEDTNDVVQEVFLKVFRNIASFRGNSSLKTWIYRIAINEAHNHRRWFSRHKRREVGLEDDLGEPLALGEVLPDPGRTPFEIAAGHEAKEIVEKALGKVNPLFRAAVVLRDVHEMSYEEIADVLNVSLGTVKSRILRGREALRRSLTQGPEAGPELELKAQLAE